MKLLRITLEGKSYEVGVELLDDGAGVSRAAGAALSTVQQVPHPMQPSASPPARQAAAGGLVASPMAGNVFKCLVKAGDLVAVNQTVIVLDAMKMETPVVSPLAGTVQVVLVKVGDAVDEGTTLLQIEG
ncbi:MAG: biotin/lipoyl-containing protein [Geobacter sp.]